LTATTARGRRNRINRVGIPALTLLIWILGLSSARGSEAVQLERWRLKAAEFERRGAWLEACRSYEDILRRDRMNSFAREGYQRCLRRLHIVIRHNDPLYRQVVARLSSSQALDTYEQVLTVVSVGYPDRGRTSLATLFQQGLQELQLALEDNLFRQTYLPGVKLAAINAYKNRLASWAIPALNSREDVRKEVRVVINSAVKDKVPYRLNFSKAVALEFAAGACNALDEYSAFISPGSMAMIQAALRGKVAGVGVELGIGKEKANHVLQITRVYPKSPAYDAGLQRGDRVIRINGVRVEDWLAEAAAERLRGDAGTSVDIEVVPNDPTIGASPDLSRGSRTVKLTRRAIVIPSIESEHTVLPDGTLAGYVRINHFQDSTLQEVKDAVAGLSASPSLGDPIKGLILDLRGNPGGLFHSAVAVAELFLHDGIIVIGQSPFKEFNQPFKVEVSGPSALLTLPMVILIDGETASAAEVLAGSLKGSRSGRAPTLVMGQTSYGKGSVQCIIPLDKAPLEKLTGIRLTVARLLSPTGQPYTGRGITPDVVTPLEDNALLQEARKRLLELIVPPMPTRPAVAAETTA